MHLDLLALSRQSLGEKFPAQAAKCLGEVPDETQAAVSALLSAVLDAMARQFTAPDAASTLLPLIRSVDLDAASPGNADGLIRHVAASEGRLAMSGRTGIVTALLGDRSGPVANAVAASTGIRSSSATDLLGVCASVVLAVLKKLVAEHGLDARSLASLIARQNARTPDFAGKRLSHVLEPATKDSVKHPAKPGLLSWGPWLMAGASIVFFYLALTGKPLPEILPAVSAASAAADRAEITRP